jgi:hypothetical protein
MFWKTRIKANQGGVGTAIKVELCLLAAQACKQQADQLQLTAVLTDEQFELATSMGLRKAP